MPAAAASTIFAAAVALRPTAAAAIVTTLTKLRRSRPSASATGLSKDRRSFMLVASLLWPDPGPARCRLIGAPAGPRWGERLLQPMNHVNPPDDPVGWSTCTISSVAADPANPLEVPTVSRRRNRLMGAPTGT